MALKHQSSTGLKNIFQPRSIAIVGASSDPTKTGGRPVHMLTKHGYKGKVFPINPNADEVQGLKAYAALDALPEVPDLMLVVVPGKAALDALETGAAIGVGAAVVLSAGFAESGPEGLALQERVTKLANDSGMRIVGPNCLGSVSVRERAIGTFSIALEQNMPQEGGVSIVSQSGNIGSAALRMMADAGAGVARFIATGNEADVQVADAIAWLAEDPDTKVILCCMETCRDASRLIDALDAARNAGKPVVVLKIGTSEVGQKAAMSHTGGLAGSERVYDAVFARHGAVRVNSLEQLVQVGAAIEAIGERRLTSSPSTALIAASGGFGVMMADAASANGVSVNPLHATTQERIKAALPLAATMNPVDATAQMSANPAVMEELLDAVVSDTANSATCILLALGMEIPRLRKVFTEAFAAIVKRHPRKVLIACISGPADAVRDLRDLGIACFPTIDSAMSAIATLGNLERLRMTVPSTMEIERTPLDENAFCNERTAKKALAAAGIPFLNEEIARSSLEAGQIAERFGCTVAMKVLSGDILHKSDIGGVVLNVNGPEAASSAFEEIMTAVAAHAPAANIEGVLISPMVSDGTELILGSTIDSTFGPTIMVGLGGIFAEVFRDTSLRLAPVDHSEAHMMLRELKAFPLLEGARGRPPADIDALADVIVALSRFAAKHQDDVAEIDINPILARPKGQSHSTVALDALIVPKPGSLSEAAQ